VSKVSWQWADSHDQAVPGRKRVSTFLKEYLGVDLQLVENTTRAVKEMNVIVDRALALINV
jgi:hypothetical protein